MPLNASFTGFPASDTLLTARLRAAENPLRIPKVIAKSWKSRFEHYPENTVIYYFIDGFEHYPG